ncbi:MAG: class I SAM-dependent methyltransferase [Akkermansiaceae bacterium]
MKRTVESEILDELSGDDPRALRSRRDLRLINFLMGNERWILKQVKNAGSMVELGAGDGSLTRKLTEHGAVTGLDFQAKPEGLEANWKEGDLFETLAKTPGEVVVANLILHHFQDEQLRKLGELLRPRKHLVFVEPWRSCFALAEGRLLFPLLNDVTRHDMMVSIRAGFVAGELPKLLDPEGHWDWKEEVSLLGGIRVLASRT